jgi:hypothetical protein
MLIGFGCLVFSGVLSIFLVQWGDRNMNIFTAVAGMLGCISVLLASAFYAYAAYSWVGAEYQASIINREYGTNYTQAEVFYASSVIDTVRELDRKRVELNGDLIRGEIK